MRVLFTTYPTAFAIPGGGEHQIESTKKYLQKIGVVVDRFDIWSPINHKSYDLLHIFSVCNSSELYVDWAIRNKIPYVISPILWPNESYSDDEAHRLRYIFNNSLYVLPNSDAEKKRIVDILKIKDRGQFRKIINGIEPEKYLSVNRKVDSINTDVVISIANIDRRKNHLLLAEACRRTNKKLLIAGRIRDISYFEEISSSYRDIVKYLGPIVNGSADHLSLLANSGIFALPSLCETPGLAALEAGASGIPVILTDVGAGKEYFGCNIKYCNPYSADSIVEAINEVTQTGYLLSKLSRQEIASHTWEIAAAQTYSVYNEVRLINGLEKNNLI